jgi:dTDP-4-amino-4,6-dideoxygalactose transaminase
MRYGRADWELPVTDKVSAQLVRLPLWAGMKESEVERVVDTVVQVLRRPG